MKRFTSIRDHNSIKPDAFAEAMAKVNEKADRDEAARLVQIAEEKKNADARVALTRKKQDALDLYAATTAKANLTKAKDDAERAHAREVLEADLAVDHQGNVFDARSVKGAGMRRADLKEIQAWLDGKVPE